MIRDSFHILGSATKKACTLSCVSKQHFVPKTMLNIDICAFTVAVPKMWNQPPTIIKSSETTATVLKLLLLLALFLFY